MDIGDKYKEMLKEQERFRRLTIKEQLDELQKWTQEYDKVIGTIYIQNPIEFDNRNQLSRMLKNAKLIEQFSVMGQGDNEINLIFSIDDLFIGVTYFAYWSSPFSMNKECKVYRAPKNLSVNNLDVSKIKKALFGY